jgi:hypothetical protein
MEMTLRSDLLDAVDALTVGSRTKVIHHSTDGAALCTPECPVEPHTHTSVVENDSLLTQLDAAIRETFSDRPGGASSLAHTRGMLDSTALFLFTRISSQIADWARMVGVPHRGNPSDMLRAWYVAWSVDHDVEADRPRASMLRSWAGQIVAALDPEETIQRKDRCPNPECVQGTDRFTGHPTWWDRSAREERLFPLIVTYRPGSTDPEESSELAPSAQAAVNAAVARCRACGTEWTARALAWELERAAQNGDE